MVRKITFENIHILIVVEAPEINEISQGECGESCGSPVFKQGLRREGSEKSRKVEEPEKGTLSIGGEGDRDQSSV